MAVDRANIIPICSYRKGKGLFSYENKPFYIPLVEISGIESPPGTRRRSAAVAAIGLYDKRSAVYGRPPPATKKDRHEACLFRWWR